MKAVLTVVLTALIFLAGHAPADGEEVRKEKIKMVIADDGADAEVFQLDGEELAVGESRQFLTESGKEIVVARGEDGLSVTVDGEELDLPSAHGHEVHVEQHRVHAAEGHTRVVKVFKGDLDDEEAHELMVHHGGESTVFISEGGEVVDIKGGHPIAWHGKALGDHLEESGALEGLTDEQRQKILDAVESFHGPKKKVVRIELHGEEEEH